MRELRFRIGSGSTVSLSGRLDPEGGARVLEVLNSLNGCRPPVDGVPDTRSPARRNADAMVEAMSCLLDEGELPTRGGQRPHLVVTINSATSSTASDRPYWTPADACPLPKPDASRAIRAWFPWCWVATRCHWRSGANTAWLPPRYVTLSLNAIMDALSSRVTEHPVIVTPTISHRGSTGVTPNSRICAYYANTITLLCTAKDGTSGSTPAGIPNSYPRKPWTRKGDHFTTHSGSELTRLPTFIAAADLRAPSAGVAATRGSPALKDHIDLRPLYAYLREDDSAA